MSEVRGRASSISVNKAGIIEYTVPGPHIWTAHQWQL